MIPVIILISTNNTSKEKSLLGRYHTIAQFTVATVEERHEIKPNKAVNKPEDGKYKNSNRTLLLKVSVCHVM